MTLEIIKTAVQNYTHAREAETACRTARETFRMWVDANFNGDRLPFNCDVDTSMDKVRAAAAEFTIANVSNLKEKAGAVMV